MRGFNYCRVLLFLVILFSSVVNAADYAWNNSFFGRYNFPSPDAVCYKIGGTAGPDYHAVLTSDTEGSCYNSSTGNTTSYLYIYRSGTTCTAPKVYDSVTKSCITPPPPDPCADKAGTDKSFIKTGVAGDGYGTVSGNFFSGGASGCFGGCAVSIPIGGQKCKAMVTGEYACKGVGQYTGQSCTSGQGDFDDSPPDTPLPPTNYSDSSPCNYSTGADGSLTCTSSQTDGQRGNSGGGEPDTSPNQTTTGIDTTISTTSNPDGSTTTVKDDTATTTICSGFGACSTSTTTTTTTTVRDGSGNTTSVTGSCEGDQCADENTNPDGDGDGFGDCVGECGEGEGGGGDWYEPGDDTYASVIGDFADRVADMPVVAGVQNFLTVAPTGSCPVYEVHAWVFDVRLDQWCTGSSIPWDLIRAIVIACGAFFAFRIAFL